VSGRIPITPEGKTRLTEEISHLKTVERPKIVREIEAARSHGDLSENAEYHAAKERQGHVEARIRFLEDHLARADVIDLAKVDGSRVVFGVGVRLHDGSSDQEVEYRIVGDLESDIQKGLISISSPIGRALIGKEVGDQVVVQTPGGRREFEIVEITVPR
jgi:transcription elongation factor GreA